MGLAAASPLRCTPTPLGCPTTTYPNEVLAPHSYWDRLQLMQRSFKTAKQLVLCPVCSRLSRICQECALPGQTQPPRQLRFEILSDLSSDTVHATRTSVELRSQQLRGRGHWCNMSVSMRHRLEQRRKGQGHVYDAQLHGKPGFGWI